MDQKVSPSLVATRYLTQEPAQLEVFGKRGVIYCRMGNLSLTGAFFEMLSTNHIPKPGDLVRIMINLKKINSSHLMYGEVVWSKGKGLGIAFIKQKELFKKYSEK